MYDMIDLNNVNTASELCDEMETSLDLGDVDVKNGVSLKDVGETSVKVLGAVGGVYAIYRGGKWVLEKTGVTKKIKDFFKLKKAERDAKKVSKKP